MGRENYNNTGYIQPGVAVSEYLKRRIILFFTVGV